jgi:hypothetical protein
MAKEPKIEVKQPSPEEVAVKTDGKIEAVFTNLEFPGQDLTFSYGGVTFTLLDGKTHELPICVVEHLNSLKYPKHKYDENAPSGQQTVIEGSQNRFSVQPVNLRGLRKETT